MKEEPAMLDKLIQYFVYSTKGYITKTQLVKFLYLADLYSVKWSGKSLTNVDWYHYHNRLWCDDIDPMLQQMEGKEIIQDSQETLILIKPNLELDRVEELDLPRGLKLILDNIRREWAGISQEKFDKLRDYLYNTEPMREVKHTDQPERKFILNLQKEQEKLLSELG